MIEASNLCASQVFRRALNTFTQLCAKTSSLGEDNVYADINSLTATPPFCFGAWQLTTIC